MDKSWNGTEFVSTTEDVTEELEGETPATWPTAEQFDAAAEQGAQTALDERRNGAEGPREAPLSGEWADDITLDQIARNVGYAPANDGVSTDLDELADAWERGYFDTWAHEDAVQADEARED